MNERRNFIWSMVAAVPVSVGASRASEAADNNVKDVVGAWATTHSSPVGPFRELLVFSAGGGVTESNTLLHTNSRLALFAEFGLPLPAAVKRERWLGELAPLGAKRGRSGLPEAAVRRARCTPRRFPGAGARPPGWRPDSGRVGLAQDRDPVEWCLRSGAGHQPGRSHRVVATPAIEVGGWPPPPMDPGRCCSRRPRCRRSGQT